MNAFAKVMLAVFILFSASQLSLHEKNFVKPLGIEDNEQLAAEYIDLAIQASPLLSWNILLLPGLFLFFTLSLSKQTRLTINRSPVFHQANYVIHNL